MKSRSMFHFFFMLVVLVSLFGGGTAVTPVRADPLPAGLAEEDWKQIQALLPHTQQAYLKASNTEGDDKFGYSVAISGDTVVVGAPYEDSNATGVNGDQANNSASSSGAAYVFTRAGGVWSQQAYLKASNTGADDWFGVSVDISGDTIVVGAFQEDSNATGVNGNGSDNSASASGAAYVFTRSGTTWSQQAYLKASNTDANDLFGDTVAIDGDTVVVGAFGEDSNATGVNGNEADNSGFNTGAAYVFTRSGTTWSQQAYLKASTSPDGNDNFGNSVDISGDTIVVGNNGEDSNTTGVNGNEADNSAGNSGAAYVFTRSGNTWSQQAYLKASNTDGNDNFGTSVAISGDTIVVAASGEDSNAAGVNGDQTDNSAGNSGAAYVFTRSGNTWSQQAYLKASNTGADDLFGGSVAISGDTIVVAASGEDGNATGVNGDQTDNSANGSGAAYVFTRSGTDWSQQAYLKASNTGADDWFGHSVAVFDDTVVVGAWLEDSNATGVNGNGADNSATDSGAAYTFVIPRSVTFNANGGTGLMNAQSENIPTALTANTFTRPGYTFSGWNTAANGSGTAYANGATYDFTTDITLYAQWTLSPTFVDVPFDYWAWPYIESIYGMGITGGCGSNPLSYCPDQAVTRAQMAVFILKGIHGRSFVPSAATGTVFGDVPVNHWAATWIEQFAAEGITAGCGNGNYCPDQVATTRAQMAVFLLRARHGAGYIPPAVNGSTGFSDVPADYWAAAWIKQFAAEGITGGCGGGNYCPDGTLTRAEMAVFLQRTFHLPLP